MSTKKLTIQDFIKRAELIHSNYDYSNVDYKNITTKVIIKCYLHGEFLQRPDKHLIGQGCPVCGGGLKLNTEEFIKKSVKIHGDKYNYDKVNYIDMLKKVIITCKEHGDFEQKPNNHVNQKQGCPSCSYFKISDTKSFIKNARLVHGYKFGYKKVIYENSKKDVIITCKEHGDFAQTTSKHLTGQGCPKCNSSKGEIKIENYLKENNINFKPQYSFPDLKNKSLLFFDFGILDEKKNLKYLIEFNGEQHYKFKSYFHKIEEKFKEAQLRDSLKLDYCLKNNIKLYIIKYNEDIEEKMNLLLEEVCA